jgi:putative membrane protein
MTDTPQPISTDHLRTDWAEDRTLMASERTFNSALGTGLGCIGVAIGLHAVFGAAEPAWLPKSVATLFLSVSLLLIWTARARAARTRKRLHEHMADSEGSDAMTVIAAMVTLGILAIGTTLWLI